MLVELSVGCIAFKATLNPCWACVAVVLILVSCFRITAKKITPGLFVMVCADIALGLITPAFSVALFLAGSWTWGGTCGRSRIYGISGEACGCLFFKCNIRPWATTYIVLKNVEESHMAYILGRFFLPLLCMLLHVRFFLYCSASFGTIIHPYQ